MWKQTSWNGYDRKLNSYQVSKEIGHLKTKRIQFMQYRKTIILNGIEQVSTAAFLKNLNDISKQTI